MLSAHDAEIVSRDGDLPGLAVLLDPEAFLEVFAQQFPETGAVGAAIQYLRYKPWTSCLCSYRITSLRGSFDVYAKAVRHGRAEKLRHWTTGAESAADEPRRRASQRWHLGISVFPDDRRLKALPRLHDPLTRVHLVASTLAHRPEWWNGTLSTLRYKPERRYVAKLSDARGPVAVLKMYDNSGFVHAQPRSSLFRGGESLRIAACTGASAQHRILAFEWLPGCSVQELLEQTRGLDAAALTGIALAELHDQDLPTSVSIRHRRMALEVVAAAGSVATACPRLALRARSLADRIASGLDESPGSLRPAHGDFYADQVIAVAGGAAFLDFDRAGLAHPAEDAATFAAHLKGAVLRGVCSPVHAEAGLDALLTGYRRRRHLPPSAQLRTYTAAALMRLAPEPFRRHASGWTELTEAVLDEAAQALDGTTRGEGRGRALTPRSNGPAVDDPVGLGADGDWSFFRPALDPGRVRGYLEAPLARLGVSRADLRQIRVTRHKPGRRCVVEYAFDTDQRLGEPLVLLGKSRIKGLNTNAHFALESLWNAGFTPERSSVCVPQPVGTLPELRMTLQRKVNGRPAGERLAHGDGALVAARIAEAIHTLHTTGAPPVRRHGIADELRILRERLPQVNAGVDAMRVEKLLSDSERLAARLPRAEPRPIHRDFYPAHVLVDGERLWLIDFDLYSAGDPALDVGNFLAHMIEERLRNHGLSAGLTETESAFESRYVQLAGSRVAFAIRTYTTLSLVRHVHLSTQYPERQHTTQALLELCERRLSQELEGRSHA